MKNNQTQQFAKFYLKDLKTKSTNNSNDPLKDISLSSR